VGGIAACAPPVFEKQGPRCFLREVSIVGSNKKISRRLLWGFDGSNKFRIFHNGNRDYQARRVTRTSSLAPNIGLTKIEPDRFSISEKIQTIRLWRHMSRKAVLFFERYFNA